MQHISPERLQEMLSNGEPIQLIDVREEYEHADFNIGGQLSPLSELFDHLENITRLQPVVVYCKMGIRSQIAIQRLEEKYGFTNLINLQGGTEAWKKFVSNR